MPVTVNDCLKLPSFADATVVAGRNGLNRVIKTVSANEAPQAADITPGEARNQQLILTAFISVRDDVGKQCDLIRRFNEFNMAGVVIFHYGRYITRLDDELIAVADALEFPIICLNPERGILYTDVTHDVFGILFNTDVISQLLVPALMDIENSLESSDSTLEMVFNQLAEKLGGALILTDTVFRLLCTSDIPTYFMLNRNEPLYGATNLLEEVKRRYRHPDEIATQPHGIEIEIGYGSIWLYHIPVNDQYRQDCHLFLFCQITTIEQGLLLQIGSIIRKCIQLDKSHIVGGRNIYTLLSAIFDEKNEYRDYLLKQMGVELSAVGSIWFLRNSGRKNHREGLLYYGLPQVTIARACLGKALVPLLIGTYLGGVVLLLNRADIDEDMSYTIEPFMRQLQDYYDESLLYTYNFATDIFQAGSIIDLIKRNYRASKTIFPHKQVFSQQDLIFVDYCREFTRMHDQNAWPIYHVLESLHYDPTLIALLEAMVLDTNMDVNESAKILFLHRNTVYYRLKKIRSLLGYDPFLMPAVSNIAISLAVNRLVLKD